VTTVLPNSANTARFLHSTNMTYRGAKTMLLPNTNMRIETHFFTQYACIRHETMVLNSTAQPIYCTNILVTDVIKTMN